MEIIAEDNLCGNAADMGEYLQSCLTDIAGKHDIMSNIRGKGLLTAFDFPNKIIRDSFIDKGLEHNVMFLGCGERSIRFRPALIIEKNHIDAGMEILEKIVSKL